VASKTLSSDFTVLMSSSNTVETEYWCRRVHLCYALCGINTWCLSTCMVIVIDTQLFQLKQRQAITSG